MTPLEEKALEFFPGKVVRKDLTALMKNGATAPTYVLEYLLGMYCATDDEDEYAVNRPVYIQGLLAAQGTESI